MAVQQDEQRHEERQSSLDAAADGQRPSSTTVADRIAPLVDRLFEGGPPVRFGFWDGSGIGPAKSAGSVRFASANALRRLIWSPNELGIARAFIVGEIDIDGDLYAVLKALHDDATVGRRLSVGELASALRVAGHLGAIGLPPAPPPEEVHLRGGRHSKARDAEAITHHYDVSDAFYRLVLGSSMTYSCARFEPGQQSLELAQQSKHDLICRKLGLHERAGQRLLDVGCGWGSMAIYAASTYGVKAVGVTLSPAQAEAARARTREAGVASEVEIRLQDYRDLGGEGFDAISSVGMFEHVGASNMDEYFEKMFSLLAPHGRLLNHAISTPGGSKMQGPTFINRYVFPDGELIDVAEVVAAMERAGFEVRDVESLREHYAKTLRAWVANLEASWDEAVELVGAARARIWRLYMAGSANGFEDGGLAVHQVLGVRPGPGGSSGMPPTRADWH